MIVLIVLAIVLLSLLGFQVGIVSVAWAALLLGAVIVGANALWEHYF